MRVSDLKYYAKGRRGVVYFGSFKGKRVAVKQRSEKAVTDRLFIEAEFLKKLNKKRIGPRFFFFEKGKLAMEFIDGKNIKEFMKRADKKSKKEIAKKILKQCFSMDEMGIDKGEMHHPIKHIIIRNIPGGPEPVMIDFERCKHAEYPKNVTQFCQYLCNVLDIDCEKLRKLAQDYKKNYSREKFEKILSFIN